MTIQPQMTAAGATLPDFDRLKGMDVYDLNDDKIGSVGGVYVDGDEQNPGSIRYLAVESGWFGSKRHIIPLDDVQLSDRGDALVVPYGRDHLETAPTYDDRDKISTDEEERIYGHYGRPGYWEAVRAKQSTPAPTPEVARADAVADLNRGRDASSARADRDDRLTVAERQTTPAPTPEIAQAEIADDMARGDLDAGRAAPATDQRDGFGDRDTLERDGVGERRGVHRYEW